MRQASLFSFLLLFCCLIAGAQVSSASLTKDFIQLNGTFELFMEFPGRGSSQGGACYDKYLFVGIGGNSLLDVYDLEHKKRVDVVKMPGAHPTCHANTINFGSRYYQEGDDFPLLYVSSGNRRNPKEDLSNTYVYRLKKTVIQKDSLKFTAELVQTIGLSGFHGWSEFMTDIEHDAVWVRGSNDKTLTFYKYPVPDSHQKYVVLTPTDDSILDTIQVPCIKSIIHNQGYFCKDGYIYCASGMPRETPYWVAINMELHDYEYVVNLYEVPGFDKHTHRGNRWEPEYLFFYNGDYFMGFRHSVYKIDLEPLKASNYFYHRYKLLVD